MANVTVAWRMRVSNDDVVSAEGNSWVKRNNQRQSDQGSTDLRGNETGS